MAYRYKKNKNNLDTEYYNDIRHNLLCRIKNLENNSSFYTDNSNINSVNDNYFSTYNTVNNMQDLNNVSNVKTNLMDKKSDNPTESNINYLRPFSPNEKQTKGAFSKENNPDITLDLDNSTHRNQSFANLPKHSKDYPSNFNQKINEELDDIKKVNNNNNRDFNIEAKHSHIYNSNSNEFEEDSFAFSIPKNEKINALHNNCSETDQNFQNAKHSTGKVLYKPKKRSSQSKSFLFLIVMVVAIFLFSFLLRQFVFQAYEIPSGSMEKTIMTGDLVFAEKISFRFSSPKKGDIITFTDPLDNSRILIKRVIATEGQMVDIKNNQLYIDDVLIDEPYINGLPTTKLKSSSLKFPYKVPEGQLWVMGDNRTNSQDSRYFGPIKKETVIGKALAIYWPFDNAKLLN